ncbi:MAG: metallophosphoesterase [Gracilibacteraceae bacterium]|nr:metallophosphoesterase [Gracilibacteraceae bacterium]
MGRVVLFAVLGIMILAAAYYFISGYVKTLPALSYEYYTGDASPAPYPDVRFALMSDLHYYDGSVLGAEGEALQKYMNADRKLLLDSIELLDFAINQIEAVRESDDGPQLVLVPGDLTKDGERINHEQVVARLQAFVDMGLPVYVVPGNHDINNHEAVCYVGGDEEPVDTVSSDEFAQIYGNMGFNDALMRDEDSLSYVAEPVPGLWLIGLDACRYRENQPGHESLISGKISQTTENWLVDVLKQAISRQKAVFVLTHHGVVEHWEGQAKQHPQYLIQDYQYVGRLLASYKVRLVFSGHYHAQDVAYGNFAKGFLYDVETGSLVTPPCPVRFCSISNNTMTIESVTLVDKLRPGTDFAEQALAFARASVISEAYNAARSYKVPEKDAQYVAEGVGDAFMAHYAGDEDVTKKPPFDKGELGIVGRFVYWLQKYVVENPWVNPWPEDNNVVLYLDGSQ